jgi:glycosyltransferase involved in cell wall biosynthesis
MKPHILFIVNTLKRRGAEQQLFSFIKPLTTYVAVHVFTFSSRKEDFPEMYNCEKVQIHTNPYGGTFNLLRIRPLIQCFRNERIDIVVTVGLGAALVLGRLAAVMFNKKIIYSTLNTFVNFNRLPRVKDAYFDFLNTGINRLLPIISKDRIFRFLPNSDQLTKLVATTLKGYPVRTLHNGLPLNELSDTLETNDGTGISDSFSEANGRPTVIQVGALDANKNIIFTLECMRKVKEIVLDACLVVVGDGPRKTDLENWTRKNNLEDCVLFTGQLSRADCIALMKKANLITLTSLSESFPNVLLEGQGLGLPAVTFDVGAACEIVKHGETGYVIPINDQDEFTKRLVELLKDRDQAKTMGIRGKERVRNKFTMVKKVEAFMQIVEQDMQQLKKRV